MIHNRVVVASGARSSGAVSVDASGKDNGESRSSGKMSIDVPFSFEGDYQF